VALRSVGEPRMPTLNEHAGPAASGVRSSSILSVPPGRLAGIFSSLVRIVDETHVQLRRPCPRGILEHRLHNSRVTPVAPPR
jgi:hypothetical protein